MTASAERVLAAFGDRHGPLGGREPTSSKTSSSASRRHRYMKRWLMPAVLCGVLGGFLGLLTGPAGAAPLSDCTADRGTIVAVDFARWGGPIVRGCGIDQPSGYALLHAAAFTTAGDTQDGPAFTCRIGNQAFHDGTMYPTPNVDLCVVTPSTSAYWSYWLAPAGQSTWTYSPLGAMGDVPRPGEVELWMFGATNIGGSSGSGVPRFSPSTLRAASTAATTRTTSTTSTSSRTTPTTSATTTTTTSTITKSTGPAIVSAQPTRGRTSAGSAVPLVVGICLVLALAAGAAWAVWRRRHE
jgi:hypothetical protein